jgi:hypothetical protein
MSIYGNNGEIPTSGPDGGLGRLALAEASMS